jgi:hypothetical protein
MVDENLLQGKSVTGILHLVNKTPIDCYSKKQATVETVTYGSEFVVARICVEQIIDLLHYDNWTYLSKRRATCLVTINL